MQILDCHPKIELTCSHLFILDSHSHCGSGPHGGAENIDTGPNPEAFRIRSQGFVVSRVPRLEVNMLRLNEDLGVVPEDVLALCPGMIDSGWVVDALRLLGVGW